MIIDFNRYNGGGSTSGVTPEQVQQQIDSALTHYWESAITESAITEAVSGLATEQYVQDALSGVSLEGYWTSAQTQDAISAATAGKADKQNITANVALLQFPSWNSQGVITGKLKDAYNPESYINGKKKQFLDTNGNGAITIYAPVSAGTAGDILVSTGNGAPVWSSITMPDMSEYWTSAETESAITAVEDHLFDVEQVTASALTELHDGLLEVSARTVDMSGYWNSAVTEEHIASAATILQDQIDEMDEVISDALNDLNGKLASKVSSSSVSTIWRGTQAEYNAIVNKDSATLYIIVNNN